MIEELQDLALSGATTLVGAMATDAWQAARNKLAELVGRRDPAQEPKLKSQLDSSAELIAGAANAEQARQALVPMWHMQLEQLLQHDHSIADDLRRLIDDVRDSLPESQQNWVQNVQNNIAKNGGLVFASQGGNVFVHQVATGSRPSVNSQDVEEA